MISIALLIDRYAAALRRRRNSNQVSVTPRAASPAERPGAGPDGRPRAPRGPLPRERQAGDALERERRRDRIAHEAHDGLEGDEQLRLELHQESHRGARLARRLPVQGLPRRPAAHDTRQRQRGAARREARPERAPEKALGPERELPRALDRGRELALVPRAHARQAARQDLAALGQEAPQRAFVLVVEHTHARLAYGTGLGRPSHASSSSISSTSAAITAGAASGLAGKPSDTTTRNRNTPSSSFTTRSYSGSSSAAASNCATT